MYRNPDDFPGYGDSSNEADYANPVYYGQELRSTHPVQPLNTSDAQSASEVYSGYTPDTDYTEYARTPTGMMLSAYDQTQMQAYTEPKQIEGYTVDVGAEQREAAQSGTEGNRKKRRGLAGLGGLVTTLGALLLKLKGLFFLIKFGPALLSAIVSVVLYSFLFGWTFAVGLVALLFIHEMGHALVMKLKGIPVGALIFIPMLGAAVMMRQMPQNARDEAEVGIAGPIAGALAASVCLAFAEAAPYTQTVWTALAYFGFFMNLFNLIPIVPFDGGRVLAAIDRRVWILGFAALLGYQIWLWLQGNFSPWLLFFVIMAATQLWSRNKVSNASASETEQYQTPAYYEVATSTRIVLGIVYFGLAAVLVLGMTIAHSMMVGL